MKIWKKTKLFEGFEKNKIVLRKEEFKKKSSHLRARDVRNHLWKQDNDGEMGTLAGQNSGSETSGEGGTSAEKDSGCETPGWNGGGGEFRVWDTLMEWAMSRIARGERAITCKGERATWHFLGRIPQVGESLERETGLVGRMDMEAWMSGFKGYAKEWGTVCTRGSPCKWGSGTENEWEENGCSGGCRIPVSLSEEMGTTT